MGDVVVKYWRGGPFYNLTFKSPLFCFVLLGIFGFYSGPQYLGCDLRKSSLAFFPLPLIETGRLEGLQVPSCPSPDQIKLRKSVSLEG